MIHRLTLLLLLIIIVILGVVYLNSSTNSNMKSKQREKDASLSKVLASKEIRIGSALEELPWGDIDKTTGEEIGGEVEIANLVAKKLGVKLNLINKGFDYLIPELLNKQYDVIIAGFSITDERKKQVSFTNPYIITGLSIIVKKSNTSIQGVSDLTGKKVGVLAGTTSKDFAQKLNGVDVRVYDDPGKYITDTKNGVIDATIYDATAAHRYIEENQDLTIVGPLLQKESYGMALRKEDIALLSKLNEVIAAMRTSSDFKTIVSKWYGPTE